MPLDNTAKIGDIILALQNMEGINQRDELASVVGTPVVAGDNVATQITAIQGAKDIFASKMGIPNTVPLQEMANTLFVGKKWASGVVDYTNVQLGFTMGAGSTRNEYYIQVNGLDFSPSIVLAHDGNGTTITLHPQSTISNHPLSRITLARNYAGVYRSSSIAMVDYQLTSPAHNNNGFLLPVIIIGTYEWLAIE